MGAARWSALLSVALVLLAGCVSPPRTTRLTADDFVQIAEDVSEQLRGSDLLADRTPESPRMVVAISRLENLSSDVIPESEQWWLMERLRGAVPIQTLAGRYNIVFAMPVERVRQLRERGLPAGEPVPGGARSPTHEMTGTFRSITRTAGRHRADLYLFEARITDLESGELVWVGATELKRAAFGRSWD